MSAGISRMCMWEKIQRKSHDTKTDSPVRGRNESNSRSKSAKLRVFMKGVPATVKESIMESNRARTAAAVNRPAIRDITSWKAPQPEKQHRHRTKDSLKAQKL